LSAEATILGRDALIAKSSSERSSQLWQPRLGSIADVELARKANAFDETAPVFMAAVLTCDLLAAWQ